MTLNPLRRPAILAALTIILVCVPVADPDVTAAVHVTPADVASAGFVAVVGLRVLAGTRLPRSALWLALGATVLGLGVATLVSQDPDTSRAGLLRYLQLFVLVPLGVVLAVRERRDLRLVCAALLAAAVLEGAVGTVQYLTGSGASYGGRDVRAVGTFGALDVMGMATVVGYGVVVALGLALVSRGRWRPALLVLAGLLVIPLLLSFSRGALLATGAAVAVMLPVARPRLALRAAAFAGPVALLLTQLVGPAGAGTNGVAARLATIGSSVTAPDRSVSDRYALWRTAEGIWRDHPVTGVGLKRFAAFRDSYAPLDLSSGSDVADPSLAFQREPLLSPHNMYLLVLSEQGVLGGAAFAGLLLGVAVLAVRRTHQWRARPPLHAAAAAGIAVWTVVDFLYSDIGGESTVLTSVLLGVALCWAVQPGPREGAR